MERRHYDFENEHDCLTFFTPWRAAPTSPPLLILTQKERSPPSRWHQGESDKRGEGAQLVSGASASLQLPPHPNQSLTLAFSTGQFPFEQKLKTTNFDWPHREFRNFFKNREHVKLYLGVIPKKDNSLRSTFLKLWSTVYFPP